MFKKKWPWLAAGIAAIGVVLMKIFAGNDDEQLVKPFKDELMDKISQKKEDALQDAEKKHNDTVDSDVSDWLDDELGPRNDGAA